MDFDWTSFALEIVNFLVLVWVLKRFLYAPVMQAVARRRDEVARTLAEAAQRRADADALEGRYRGRLADWETEKQALRARALEEAEAERKRRLAELQRALGEERERQRAVTERELEEQRAGLERDALEQGERFAARLLGRFASPELEALLARAAAQDLARLPAGQRDALRAASLDAERAARVTSAFPLAAAERRLLLEALAAAAGRALEAEFAEDRGLAAGVRIEVGPWLLQADLADELEGFAEAARRGA